MSLTGHSTFVLVCRDFYYQRKEYDKCRRQSFQISLTDINCACVFYAIRTV